MCRCRAGRVCASNVVPGVEFSPDKMLQGRIFAYADTYRYRIATNYAHLPINRPLSQADNYQRDGAMNFTANGGGSANYEPNSVNGPKQAPEYAQQAFEVSGTAAHTPYERHADDDDFIQAGNLYRLMSDADKSHLISNLTGHMKAVTRREIQIRQIWNFYRADTDYGTRLAQGLGINIKGVLKAHKE